MVVFFTMLSATSTLPDDPQELKRIIAELQSTQHRYEQENDLLREQIRLLYARIFGKKGEKGKVDPSFVQLPLFDMPEPEVEPEKEAVEVPTNTREKAGRKKPPENLPGPRWCTTFRKQKRSVAAAVR